MAGRPMNRMRVLIPQDEADYYQKLLRFHPDRIPMTDETFQKFDEDWKAFYWRRRLERRPSELAARCMLGERQ